MKITNIALHAVLAVIGTASCASAKGFFRGSVKEKEDERRETMGDLVSDTYLDKCADNTGSCSDDDKCGALILQSMTKPLEFKDITDIESNADYMKACYKVAEAHNACVGCRGYELEATDDKLALTGSDPGMVHIPGCMNMSIGDCHTYAMEIVANHPDWFPEATIINDSREVSSLHENWYWMLALPVDGPVGGFGLDGPAKTAMNQRVKGLAGDCMVYYPYQWCVSINTGKAQCTQLAPFDCTDPADATQCLPAGECCAHINGKTADADGNGAVNALYPWPDINGNKLQCYAWPINPVEETLPDPGPGTPPTGTGGTGTNGDPLAKKGLRLIMITNRSKIIHPALITAMKGAMIESDNGFSFIPDKDNINKWKQDYDNVDDYMKAKGKGLPVFNEDTEKSMAELTHAQANNDWWDQSKATGVPAESGYDAGKTSIN